MNRYLIQLLLLTVSLLPVAATARDCDLYADAASSVAEETGFALLRWEPPTKNVDGDKLNAKEDLKRYDIFLIKSAGDAQKIGYISSKEESCRLKLPLGENRVAMKSIGSTESGKDDPSVLSNRITLTVE